MRGAYICLVMVELYVAKEEHFAAFKGSRRHDFKLFEMLLRKELVENHFSLLLFVICIISFIGIKLFSLVCASHRLSKHVKNETIVVLESMATINFVIVYL